MLQREYKLYKYKIRIFICNKSFVDTKMSRVCFDVIEYFINENNCSQLM
jgi:hypothetical protein